MRRLAKFHKLLFRNLLSGQYPQKNEGKAYSDEELLDMAGHLIDENSIDAAIIFLDLAEKKGTPKYAKLSKIIRSSSGR